MKRLFFCFLALWSMLAVNAQNDNGLKVVVSKDGQLVGRYVRQTATTYIANPLDWEEEVPKKGYRVEVWSPENGKGFIVRADGVTGNINVRKGASTRTAVVATITEADSAKDYPENSFPCIGKYKNWYKIKIKGKVGYVREDLVCWAAYYAD